MAVFCGVSMGVLCNNIVHLPCVWLTPGWLLGRPRVGGPYVVEWLVMAGLSDNLLDSLDPPLCAALPDFFIRKRFVYKLSILVAKFYENYNNQD
jgi:hypothetical protein